jgi:hypothetical protein
MQVLPSHYLQILSTIFIIFSYLYYILSSVSLISRSLSFILICYNILIVLLSSPLTSSFEFYHFTLLPFPIQAYRLFFVIASLHSDCIPSPYIHCSSLWDLSNTLSQSHSALSRNRT